MSRKADGKMYHEADDGDGNVKEASRRSGMDGDGISRRALSADTLARAWFIALLASLAFLAVSFVAADREANAETAAGDAAAGDTTAGDAAADGAVARDVFTIFDLKIDERAENALLARKAGLEKAQGLAYRKLMEKLVAELDRERLPSPSPPLLARLVSGLDIRDERRGAGHYLATIDVHFRADAVRGLFRDLAVRYSETPAVPHDLLAFGQEAGRLQDEGEEGGRWRQAVEAADIRNRLVPLRSMADGPFRRILISHFASRGSAVDPKAVCRARKGRLVVMRFDHLPPFGARLGRLGLNLRSCDAPEFVWKEERAVPDSASLWGVARDLASAALDALDEAWRQETLIAPDEQGVLVVRVPSRTLDELRRVEGVLRSVNLVRDVDLVELALPESRISIRFEGRRRLLSLALAQRGWSLVERDGDAWLRPTPLFDGSNAAAGLSREEKGRKDD